MPIELGKKGRRSGYSWRCFNYIHEKRARSQCCMLLFIMATACSRNAGTSVGHSTSINLFSTRSFQLFGMSGNVDNILLILDTESEGTKSKIHRESPSSTGKKDGQKHDQIRQWIASTAVGIEEGEEEDGDGKSPKYFYSTPTKLLYAICNKLRPIRTSPDYMLRIRSASEEDANIAAFAMFHLASCYSSSPSSPSILTDRRFEQLVECILCQLHIPKDLRVQKKNTAVEEESAAIEAELASIDQLSSSFQAESSAAATLSQHDVYRKDLPLDSNNSTRAPINAAETATLMRESHHHRGLTILDASHAVWALSKLLDIVSHHNPSISRTISFAGILPQDIIIALGLRCKEVLQQPTSQTIDQQRQTAKDIAFMIQAFSYAQCVYYSDPDLFLLSDTLMDLACTKLFTSTNINATNTTITNTSTEESEQDAVKHVVDEKDNDDQRYVHLLPETELAQILWYLAIRQKKKSLSNMEHITLFTNITKQAVIDRLEQQYHQLEQRRKRSPKSYDDEETQSTLNEKKNVSTIITSSVQKEDPSTEDESHTCRTGNITVDTMQSLAFEDGVCVIDYNTSTTEEAYRESNDSFLDVLSSSNDNGGEEKPSAGFQKIAGSINISENLSSHEAKETLALEDGICGENYNTTTNSASIITKNDLNSESLQSTSSSSEDIMQNATGHEVRLPNYCEAEAPSDDLTYAKEGHSLPNEEENRGEAVDSMKEVAPEKMVPIKTSLNTHSSVPESDALEIFQQLTSIPTADLSDSLKIDAYRSSAQQHQLDIFSNSTFDETVEKEGVTSLPTSLDYVAPTLTPSFSGSDVCSILWSLSEIDGHVQIPTMDSCLEILLSSYDSESRASSSADLVTVVWSIAKFISVSSSSYNPQQLSSTMEKIQRTLEIVSSLLLSKLVMGETSFDRVTHFDLMRLIPSLESIYSNPAFLRKDNASSKSACSNTCAVTQLCTKSLMSAILFNKDFFSVTELALLVSSVISLNIQMGCELSHNSVQALGCLQAIVEASLLNTVSVLEHITEENSTISNQGFIVPFLGKSRWIRSKVMLNDIENAVDTSIAALDDMNSILSAVIHLTYCLCQYSGREQTFFAGGVIRFFALCIAGPKPLDDLFRMLQPIEVTKLLWACAKAISPQSTSYSSASREASNAVGRKLLHELIRNKNKGEGKGDLLESFLTTLDASYQCKFLWSLSKLYGKEIQQERSNGKKLSLYCSRLWEGKKESIALSDLSNLLWAMSHLGMLAHQKISDFKGLLSNIELKLSTGSHDDLFFLFQSLAIARRSITQMTKEKNEVTPASSHSDEELDDEVSKSLVAMVPDTILLCDQVITKTSDQLLKAIPSYTCFRLRQFLQIYSTMPLVIGNFLFTFEEEIKLRLSILCKYEIDNNSSSFIEQLQERAQDLHHVFYKITGTSIASGMPSTPLNEDQHATKKKIRWNIFASPRSENSLQFDGVDNNLNDSLGSFMDDMQICLRRLSTVMNETMNYFSDMDRLKVLPERRFSSLFYELGKCQELVRAASIKDEEATKNQHFNSNSGSVL